MKIKYFVFVAVIAIAFLSIGNVAKASCLEQNFAQKTEADKIQCLTSVIADLTQQITAIQAQQQIQSTTCHDFNSNLGFVNSFTSEVTKLHEILKKENISYGDDTENEYTQATADAISQLQKKYGIPSSGFVGQMTRAKLNGLYGCEKNKSSALSSQTVPKITLISPNGPNEVFEITKPKIDISWDSVGLLPTDKITIWLVDYSGSNQKRLLIVRDIPGDRKEYSDTFYGPTPGEKFKVVLQVVRGIGSLPGDESDNYFTIVTTKELSGPVIEILGSNKIVKGVNASWTVKTTNNSPGGLTLSVDWGDGQVQDNIIIYGRTEGSVAVEKNYTNEGNYTAIFSVRNNLGQTTKLTKVISVFSDSSLITTDVTSVSFTSFRVDKSEYTPGETIKFSVVAVDQDGNYLSPSSGVKLYLNTIDPTNKITEDGEMQYVGAGSYKFETTIMIFDNIPGLWSAYVTPKKNGAVIGTGSKIYYNIKKIVATTQCEDSDGMDYYTKGTATYLGNSSTDFCNSGGVVRNCFGANCYLNESYCYSQNQIGEKSDITCLYGCTDGACNKSSSAPVDCSPVWRYGQWSACVDGIKTRTKTNGNTNPACAPPGAVLREEQACADTSATCIAFTYSSWSICANSTQTRTITSFFPTGCTGGSPETLLQTCTAAICSVSDGTCPANCSAGVDADCCRNAGKFWLQTSTGYGCYSTNISTGCSAGQTCSTISDNCCPTGCSAGSDTDCCQNTGKFWLQTPWGSGCYDTNYNSGCSAGQTCGLVSDGCCPNWCSAGSDADCCRNAGYNWVPVTGGYNCVSTQSSSVSPLNSLSSISNAIANIMEEIKKLLAK